MLEETFSYYFYKFLRLQAKKKRFFSKILSRKQEKAINFFVKIRGEGLCQKLSIAVGHW